MEFYHGCWSTLGELYFRIDNVDLNKVNIFRCCYLEPFKTIDISEIENIDLLELFNESLNAETIIQPAIRDRCSMCKVPSTLEKVSVSISKLCNLNCYNCFFTEHRDTKAMKHAYFSVLEKIKGLKLKELKLTDVGEPFIYFDQITLFLSSLRPDEDVKQVQFITNATLLNKERIQKLKSISEKTKITYYFHISCDGITKESYERIRKGGNFEKVIENIKNLKDIFGIHNMNINYVIKKYNFDIPISRVYEFFSENFELTGPGKVCITYDLMDHEAEKIFKNTTVFNAN